MPKRRRTTEELPMPHSLAAVCRDRQRSASVFSRGDLTPAADHESGNAIDAGAAMSAIHGIATAARFVTMPETESAVLWMFAAAATAEHDDAGETALLAIARFARLLLNEHGTD